MSTQPSAVPAGRQMLRHTLATLAYRANKALTSVPPEFASFKAGERTRTPAQILGHLGDLMDWGISMAIGQPAWKEVPVTDWQAGIDRFFAATQKFDDVLASDAPLACEAEGLFQGPIADALTHVGQINLLRGIAACPVKAENYFKAEIVTGRVGTQQTPPRREF
jgi:hypothetical protein